MNSQRKDSIKVIGTATSWNDLKSKIGAAIQDLNNPNIIWYRGQNDSKFNLLPSIFRYANGPEKEWNIYLEYRRWVPQKDQSDDPWYTLFNMQHYRIPTRLLDWTEVLGIAVFFSMLEAKEEASIFVLDPKRLNSMSNLSKVERPHYLELPGQRTPGISAMFLDISSDSNEKKGLFTRPIAIKAPMQNPRIRAQSGTFTLHGTDRYNIDFFRCIREVRFNYKSHASIKTFLQDAGCNEFRVFPDIEGVHPFIKSLVGLKTIEEYLQKKIKNSLQKKMENLAERAAEVFGD